MPEDDESEAMTEENISVNINVVAILFLYYINSSHTF